MTVSINQNYVNTFSANLHHLVGAQGSKTKGIFAEETASGEKHFFDRLGDFSISERTERFADTVLQDAAHSRRMATVRLYDAAVGLDKIDINKMLINPSSDYIMKLKNVFGQKFDEVVFAALLGDAATGQTGEGTASFDSNNVIAHGGTGLTVTKLDEAIKILKSNRVDMSRDGVCLFIDAKAEQDLLADAKITSFDYQPNKVLGGPSVPTYRGLKIVMTEDLPEHTAGSVYRAILCTQDALKIAVPESMGVSVDKRPDKSNTMQIYADMMLGAVRMEEAKVVDILFQ
jgi:hypothetical protein